MSVVRREALRRWAVVGAFVAALCATPVALAALPAASSGRDAAEQLRRVLASGGRPHEGLIEVSGSLGLPDMPGLDEATGPLHGTSRLRTWYDGPRRWRVAALSTTGERDYLGDGDGLDVWDYERNQLTRVVGRPVVRLPNASDLTPPSLGRRLLRLVRASDKVTALKSRRIAGKSADGMRVTTGDSDTTVGAVDVWSDPSTGVPLEVHVLARGATRPALSTRFLEFAARRPAADEVAPRPARGLMRGTVDAPDLLSRLVTFTNLRLPDRLAGRAAMPGTASVASIRGYQGGFASLAVAPLPPRYGQRLVGAAQDAGADITPLRLPARSAGGSPIAHSGEYLMLTTPLLNAMLFHADAGTTFLLVGAVRPDVLRTAAAELTP
ncbi:hypothetical protein [Actinomadura rupiterrae]|uniref:hypothetical protein n=1 Tax=Actinomadura rupiterrae TaxID=559627 RepID=UPI0020A4E3A3|nr:hypothetical protein [Actinomadura rupiterrae]MCP2334740.1 hypothetical protein [Actinomadura rupiterrae]